MNVKRAAVSGRRSARWASIAAVVIAGGLLSGTGSSANESKRDTATAPVSYDCRSSSQTRQVEVTIAVTLPASGVVGTAMQPGAATVTATLTRADLDALLPAATKSVLSTAKLTVTVGQNDATAKAQWADLASQGIAVPDTGDLLLVHTGEVPSVTVGAPGDVTFDAGELDLVLRSVDASGETPDAAGVSLTCTPADGEKTLLGTVPVPEDSGSETPSGTPGTEPSGKPGGKDRQGIAVEPQNPGPAGAYTCPPAPTGEPDVTDAPPAPPGPVEPIRRPNPGAVPVCAYAVGVADVHKLNGAMVVNDPAKTPAVISILANMYTESRGKNDGYYQRFDSIGSLKLPDAESTFLTFGFEPVSAKVEFDNGLLSIFTGSIGFGPERINFARASFMQSLRLYDVKVNGTQLDVGNNCRTGPFKVILDGDFPKYVNVLLGGPLNGTVKIPPFTGCNAGGEDLNALFTASISGDGNYLSMVQGATCNPNYVNPEKNGCPPSLPPLPTN